MHTDKNPREPGHVGHPIPNHPQKPTTATVINRSSWLTLLITWFALLSGLAEVSLLALEKFVLHRLLYVGPDVVWQAPLANLLLFAFPGVIFFIFARFSLLIASQRTIAFTFAFLCFLNVLVMFPLHKLAVLLFAAGLAVQIAGLIARNPHGFYRFARHTVKWLVGVVFVLAVGPHIRQEIADRRALANLPLAPSGAANVLLITLDTVRAESVSMHGYSRATTPYLQRLAKTGVRFDRAMSVAPWTAPSFASMFTGHYPSEISANWRKGRTPLLDDTYPTLAEVLSLHGYLTAGFSANTQYCSYEVGLDRGFTHFEDYLVSPGQIILSSSLGRIIGNTPLVRRFFGYYDLLGRKTAAKLNRDFLDWLSRNKGRPFFAFLNYYDAHEPYLPPDPFAGKFGPESPRDNTLIWHPWPVGERAHKENMSPQEVTAELAAYEGSISFIDHSIELLFQKLQALGVLKNTLIIITSDHGEQFGEHGLFTHANSLYLPLLHVPLMISFPPRLPVNMIVREAVSLRDIPATVIDLLDLETTVHFPGNSLGRYWNKADETSAHVTTPLLSEAKFAPGFPKHYPTSKGDMKSLIAGSYHYIRNGDGQEELYNFKIDPAEENNLVDSAEGQRMLVRFREHLHKILVSIQTPK